MLCSPCRRVVSARVVLAQNRLHYSQAIRLRSRAIVNKVHPLFKRKSFLLPHNSHSIPKCLRRSLVIRNSWSITREHQIVEMCCQISSILFRHCPHCPNYASESTVLNCRSKVESVVGDASFCQLCCVTSREECKLCIGESRSHDVKQSKAIVLVKSE